MQIRYCRIEKMYSAEHKRLVLSVEATGIRAPLKAALLQTGAVAKHGRAPAGAMEFDMQEWLEELMK